MNARAAMTCVALLIAGTCALPADPVAVKHVEGRIHGFLVLRDVNDAVIATGTVAQLANGNRVTNELTFRFKDGSLHQEKVIYSQKGVFQLLTYQLTQKGPAFKRPTDLSINASSGQVTIRYTDEDGKEKVLNERVKIPADLANGIVPTVLADVDPKAAKTTLSMLVSTPKPRIVKLEISPQGEESFSVAGSSSKALRYNVKVDIGGISGVIAPIIGKQPPDTHVWIAGGTAPGFLKSEGPLFEDGPIWRIELASPVWPKVEAAKTR